MDRRNAAYQPDVHSNLSVYDKILSFADRAVVGRRIKWRNISSEQQILVQIILGNKEL